MRGIGILIVEKKEEFKAWLQHPCTKIFEDVLKRRRELFWEAATSRAAKKYYQNEKDEQVTLLFGKVDGFDTVLGVLQYCREQIEQEIKYKDTPIGEKPVIEDSVGELLDEVKDE